MIDYHDQSPSCGWTSCTRGGGHAPDCPTRLNRVGGGPGAGGAATGAGFDLIWSLAVLALPVVLLASVITGLARGTTWMAERSWLAPLFPAPGDSLARYLLSAGTLLLLLPGGLALLVARMDATPLRPVGRLVVLPAAVLLVPVILFVTWSTASADVIRWPS